MTKSAKQRKKFTFLTRSAPYGSNRPQLCLEAALAAAVFEQQVNYVFLEDGVYQLLQGQNGESIHSKTLGSAMETLDLYGIENVYVEERALEARGLTPEDLVIPVQLCDSDTVAGLLKTADCVFNL